MDREEAKNILRSYDAHKPDLDDSAYDEALCFLEEDPELANWFKEEQAFDASFQEKLLSITPPAGLKEKLLAIGERATASASQTPLKTKSEGVTAVPFEKETKKQAWWRSPTTLSLAASIAVIFSVVTIFFQGTPSANADLPRFYNAVANHVHNSSGLQLRSNNIDELAAFLTSRSAPSPGELPSKITSMEEIGCLAFEWETRPVSVICMGEGDVHHLYVVDREDFPGETHPEAPTLMQKEDLAMMAWADPDKIYVLIVEGNTQQLAQLL